LIEEKAKLNEWRPKTQAQVHSVAELFVKMIGADDATLVNQSQVADYRSLLLNLPKNYGKDPKDFDRSLKELLEEAKTLPSDKVGRQGSTLNGHLTQLKSVIEYIETSGKSVGDYKGVQKLRAKVVTRARDARAVFTPENLRGIFAKEPWTGCESEKNRLQPGSVIIHDSRIGFRFSPRRRSVVVKSFVGWTSMMLRNSKAFRLFFWSTASTVRSRTSSRSVAFRSLGKFPG
jgi:hypothetical protein